MTIKLSVHRNTLEKRRRKDKRKNAVAGINHSFKERGHIGYAIVTWDKEFNYNAFWHTGGAMPSSILPEFVKTSLQRELAVVDVEGILKEKFGE